MEKLKQAIQQWPATSVLLTTFISIGLLFLVKLTESDPAPLLHWTRLLSLTTISASICFLLYKFDWHQASGLTNKPSQWHRKWFWATLPFLAISLLSLTSANWQAFEPSPFRIGVWLFSNFSTGLFEEVLLRGFCFYLLIKAWGTSKKGVYLAAVFQAVVFGVAHFGNLYHMPVLDVTAQVIFATLIGLGFAGLVYLTRSLWPAIIVHTCINCSGTINDYLVPGVSEFQSPGVGGYIVIIIIFLVLSTLPGLMYLRSVELKQSH